MSKPFMISYDLNEPVQKYDKVFEIIETFGSYIKLQQSFWLIRSNLTTNQMTDKLNAVLDNNDSLFICELTNNFQGRTTDSNWDFIKEHILYQNGFFIFGPLST